MGVISPPAHLTPDPPPEKARFILNPAKPHNLSSLKIIISIFVNENIFLSFFRFSVSIMFQIIIPDTKNIQAQRHVVVS